MTPLQVFIGYDPHSAVAYHVLAHSIMRRASRPVSITPLYQPQLRNMDAYTRERTAKESTEFSMTRFLTPWMTGFKGVSIFLDNDMLCLGDICELERIALSDPYQDVFVVQHPPYTPATGTKFLNQEQTIYPCKNWSSAMVFNGHRSAVRTLRPEYVSAASGMELHQFKWAQSIGHLPPEWNHLVGEQPANPNAKLIHYTIGGPWFDDYRDCEYAAHWQAEAANALNATQTLHRSTTSRTIPEDNSTVSNDGHLQRFAGPHCA